ADQKMPPDLRDLEREIEIGRKLCGFRAALLAAFSALATLLLLCAVLTAFATLATLTFLRGRQMDRRRQRTRERDVRNGLIDEPAERRRLGIRRIDTRDN